MGRIKKSIITKDIEYHKINKDLNKSILPKLGDVALFEVVSIGRHKTIQSTEGTNHHLFPGDKILVTFGARYATNQFEGYVPTGYQDIYQILGAGGVVGSLKSMHFKYEEVGPTEVKLLGYAVDKNNNVVNSIYNKKKKVSFARTKKKKYDVYLSVGASMDSGKTTTAAYFCKGLNDSGLKTAYIKLTGTVYAKDRNLVRDAGAMVSVDFSHCGYPSTYMVGTDDVLDIFATLTKHIEKEIPNIDTLIVEIADGLVQKETYALLQNKKLMKNVTGVIMSCPDSLSAFGGLDVLRSIDIEPVIIGGILTASPLMVKEVKAFTDLPVYALPDFIEDKGRKLTRLLAKAKKKRS